ncbi:diguanylate cyclase [Cypionkella aquatica]|uniref:dihydroneopterin aldolase n=1 Tax=Cypionkella aquatica TaxID=1756042 RepID=A0AA37U5S9_9RHOB|nr:dihydroneopterin aldolase [Cypionkella aquatica]GLS88891.1 diguanylate cyclase [Cypionkella aquatica]
MTSDIAQAFAHPEERSIASATADPRDRISLRDHIVEVDIGAFQKERGHTQRVLFDIVVEVRPAAQPLNDDVDLILSYDTLTEAVAAELAAERLNLLETLAERLAERILAEPQAMRVFVRIQKLDVGPYKLGVEIVRSRAEVAVKVMGHDGEEAAVHPLVVFLDNAAIMASDLASRLDHWQGQGRPVILTVGLPDMARPQTGHKPTQRRVDLLAIEQNAWVLAARDPRCVVMETRTEIDWAIKRGQMVVWAPSKLVLDAVDGPHSREPVALALWLAELMAAERLVVHGDVALPAGSRVQVDQA